MDVGDCAGNADTAPTTTSIVTSGFKAAFESRALLILAVGLVVRLLLAALIPPVPDETYYWEWSRRLAGGYFDHPYGIAFSVRAGTTLLSAAGLDASIFAVRLVPVLEGWIAGLVAVAVAQRLGGANAGVRAAIVITVMPLAAAGLVLATPDAPLFAAASVAMYGVVRALETPARTAAATGWWAVAGLGAGLAMASKYTAVLIPGGVAVALLSRSSLRPRLAEPGPYVACGIALLCIAPVLLWNSSNDWVSFTFQLRHGLSGPARGTPVGRVLEMVGGQAALVTPILFLLFSVAVRDGLRRRDGDVHAVLATTALFCFAVFALSATRKPVEANWPALAYVPAIPLLAATTFGRRAQRWLQGGSILALAVTLTIYLHSVTGLLPIAPRRDPIARSAGWDQLAASAAAQRDALADARPDRRERVHIGADRYQDASELAFHIHGQPRTFSLNMVGRPNQYDLWPGFAQVARPGDDLLLALDDTEAVHATVRALAPHFASVRRGPLVELRARRGVVATRRLWALSVWAGTWPPRAPPRG